MKTSAMVLGIGALLLAMVAWPLYAESGDDEATSNERPRPRLGRGGPGGPRECPKCGEEIRPPKGMHRGPGGPGRGEHGRPFAGGPGGPRGRRQGPMGPRGPQGGLMAKMRMLGKALELTQEQREQVKAIVTDSRETVEAAGEAVKNARQALHEIVRADEVDAAAIRAAAAKLGTAIGDEAVARTEVRNKIHALLTDEQKAKLADLREKRDDRREEHRERAEKFRGKMKERREKRREGKPGTDDE